MVRSEPARFPEQQVRGAKHLIEQAGLLMQPPRSQRPGCIGPQAGTQGLDGFGRMQKVPFQPTQIARGAAQAQQLLRAKLRDLDYVPGKSARADSAAHWEFHGMTSGGEG
jgi:hypothetical protein